MNWTTLILHKPTIDTTFNITNHSHLILNEREKLRNN